MKEQRTGFLSTLACYTLWGILPLYWHALDGIDAVFILANRIVWSAVFTVILLLVRGRVREIWAVLRDGAKMRFMIPAAFVITINWGVYIWAVNAGHLLDSSLGYYLNPLAVFAVSILFFRETCGVLEWISLALAGAGVLVATLAYGAFPWIALVLALSFCLYGTFKKLAGVGGLVSIAVETLLIAPFALGYIVLMPQAHAELAALTAPNAVLLLMTGAITSIPLVLFTYGVNRLPLSTVGFLQYISPTLQLLVGVLVFRELLTNDRIVALAFIVAALVLYSIAMIRRAKSGSLAASGSTAGGD